MIPTLDEAGVLPRLLEHLLGGEAPGADSADEVIVVDGGSCDGTAGLAQRAGACVVRAGRGRGHQLAAGARRAAGGLLLFLHADCVPRRGALGAVRRAFADPGLVASAMRQRIEAEGWFFRCVERAADRRARRGAVMGDSGLAVRREAYEAVGGFRPLALFEDLDLSRRLRAHGRLALIEGAVLDVSPRRWRAEGALRCTLRNWMLRTMYGFGVDPSWLGRLYPPLSARVDPS